MISVDPTTIFALASGTGRAAVTLLRISGPNSGWMLDQICGHRPAPRIATLRTLRGASGELLDRALVLWFPGPASYTGEDSAELHLHGGNAVLSGVTDALIAMGLVPAEAGAFTRRAFLNGKLDLLEAEAIADLVSAETSGQRQQALRQMEGGLSQVFGNWTERLTKLLAQQEALIDFPDEDLPAEVELALLSHISTLRQDILPHLTDGRRGERLRDGLVFAIAGSPNAGKSTLVNALAQRDVAIVSPQAGTTRDVLEVRLDLGGVPVTLLDTAGLRVPIDAIEAEGIRRARARMEAADIVLWVDPVDPPIEPACLWIISKIDAGTAMPTTSKVPMLGVSAQTGEGMGELYDWLAQTTQRLTKASGPPPLTRARHRHALQDASTRLDAAIHAALPELRGEELRLALRALGSVTGAVGVEDILDSVFGQFCIGK